MVSNASSYEFIFSHFQARQGLYLLGAGASSGEAPFGTDLLIAPALDYVRNSGSFPVAIPTQSELNERIISVASSMATDGIFPDSDIRAGGLDSLYQGKLRRLPNFHARLFMKNALSKAQFCGRQSDSYCVFRFFHPSVLLNYNLDGLATDLCGGVHRVINVHGTIERGYGSPQMTEFVATAREFDLPVAPDNILMCTPESFSDLGLASRLFEMKSPSPNFIALIGYSFGRNGDIYDDHVSLEFFQDVFRSFQGNVYVVDPKPDALQNMIADRLQSKNVFGISAYWNVLAHAFIEASHNKNEGKSLNFVCQQILDTLGNRIAFPLPSRY